MTVTISTVQRAMLQFDRNSTVADLIQALTENLGGEWDNARLDIGSNNTTDIDGVWRLHIILNDGTASEPARPPRWVTDDGTHVAAWNATQKRRECNCGKHGSDEELAAHMSEVAGFKWEEVYTDG
jgi:hypothetical protein